MDGLTDKSPPLSKGLREDMLVPTRMDEESNSD
jgi:hypothetical protein